MAQAALDRFLNENDTVLQINQNRARLVFPLEHQLYRGDIIVILDFIFRDRLINMLSLENYYIVPAIQRIMDEFNRNYGNDGLMRRIFVIDDNVTVVISHIDIDGYGERAHNEDEEEDDDDIQDPQCRNNN